MTVSVTELRGGAPPSERAQREPHDDERDSEFHRHFLPESVQSSVVRRRFVLRERFAPGQHLLTERFPVRDEPAQSIARCCRRDDVAPRPARSFSCCMKRSSRSDDPPSRARSRATPPAQATPYITSGRSIPRSPPTSRSGAVGACFRLRIGLAGERRDVGAPRHEHPRPPRLARRAHFGDELAVAVPVERLDRIARHRLVDEQRSQVHTVGPLRVLSEGWPRTTAVRDRSARSADHVGRRPEDRPLPLPIAELCGSRDRPPDRGRGSSSRTRLHGAVSLSSGVTGLALGPLPVVAGDARTACVVTSAGRW